MTFVKAFSVDSNINSLEFIVSGSHNSLICICCVLSSHFVLPHLYVTVLNCNRTRNSVSMIILRSDRGNIQDDPDRQGSFPHSIRSAKIVVTLQHAMDGSTNKASTSIVGRIAA